MIAGMWKCLRGSYYSVVSDFLFITGHCFTRSRKLRVLGRTLIGAIAEIPEVTNMQITVPSDRTDRSPFTRVGVSLLSSPVTQDINMSSLEK